MERLVRKYLLQHSSVSIPGLGTIYVERSPARSDFVNRQLLPPSYHFRFDKYFDAPGKDFFTFVASKKNIEDYEAIKLYNEWALGLRNSIGADNTATLEGIGTLRRDGSGDVLFEPVPVPDLFSTPVPARRIVRSNARHTMLVGDREVSNVEMSDYLHEEARRKRISWWIYAVIIAAIAIAVIFIRYMNSENGNRFGNQQTIVPR
jgi:hypothetical protein